jgi:hypothetical protein
MRCQAAVKQQRVLKMSTDLIEESLMTELGHFGAIQRADSTARHLLNAAAYPA